MNLKSNKLRDAIAVALATSIAAAIPAAVAQSQDSSTLDRISVTGSRIKRVESETQQPVLTLSKEDIQAQGLTSVGDVIQNIAANGSALNSTYNNGGNGETRVSLRNLGSNRTLVLVNGRRWVGGTGLGGAVDLNTIPTAAVERIEVLKDGASTLYGSDAIAGVVNIILRSDFDGAEANAYVGMYSKGDGKRESYDITIGSSGDRFSALLGAGYVKEEPVMAGDRAISAIPLYGTGSAFNSSTSPNGRFAVCNGTFNTTAGGCSGTQTLPNGSAGTFTYSAGTSPSAWRPYTAADSYNYAPDNYLVTPQERASIFGQAKFKFNENVSGFAQIAYNNRQSSQLLAAMPIVLGTGPGAGTQARTVAISADSMYNPFGKTISRVQRRANETGGRIFEQNVDTFAFSGGLEGGFEIGERYFSWDAGMVYGRNDQSETTIGLFNVSALRNALGPSMMHNGEAICVSTAGDPNTRIPGCVPMNLLGGYGSMTPEMLAYSSFIAHDSYGYKMKQYFANISGDIVELPGGMMAFAAGVERRTESGFDSPDALIASGNTTGNSRTPTSGSYSLVEAYAELSIPLLRDLPFARELEFSLASRYSDYSNFGDTTNSKFGFKWRPIEDLMIRGNWSQGFRAPAIAELYQGISDSFPQVSDPCSTTYGGRYNVLTTEQQARCHAQGVPVGGYDQGNAQIRINVGGNPNLLPETSISRTLGFVYSPSWLEGFDVSLDWWRIDLNNIVTSFGASTILNNCIVDGNQAFCALYTRGSGGAIDQLYSNQTNFGRNRSEGYDMTINYRLPETRFGRFSINLDSTYMSKDIDNDGDNRIGEYYDRSNGWRIRSNLMMRWEKGDVGATLASRYYSRQEEECPLYMNDYGFGPLCNKAIVDSNGIVQEGSLNQIGGTTYFDASFYVNTPWNAKVTVGVNNLTNKQPPISFSTFANSFDPQYEIPGRFVYFQYRQKF